MKNIEIIQKIFNVPVGIIQSFETLGKPLQGRRHTHYLIEAKNKREARLSLTHEPDFWKNYNQATIEERKKLHPFTLLREGKIEEILTCERRYKNRKGDYTCGKPIHTIKEHEDRKNESVNLNGEFGMCCIEGYDTYDLPDCPYNKNQF